LAGAGNQPTRELGSDPYFGIVSHVVSL
jgi:hypothetical protein